MSACIIIPIIVGIISAILGYLLGRMAGGNKDEINKLEADLSDCRKRMNQLEMEDSRMAASMSSAAVAFNAGEAKDVMGKAIKENDLTVVEGIGPAIQELFHKHGIHTWKALSETEISKCQEILDSEGERFVVHKPGTWPVQAKLAYEGHWKHLFDWQEILKGGKEMS